MDPCINSHAQFGADTICSTDQYRVLITASFEVKDATKATDFSICTNPSSGTDVGFDAFYKWVASVNWDTCLSVCQAAGFFVCGFEGPDRK
jgi:hypothetical protein